MYLLILAIVGIGSAIWVGMPAYRRHLAIRHMRRLDPTAGPQSEQPRGSAWLRRWMGNEWSSAFDDDRDSIGLDNTPANDITMGHLGSFSSLERLSLRKTQVSDRGFAHLKGLTRLQCLYLADTELSDAGLIHLRALRDLEILELRNTRVTGRGLMQLAGLPRLRFLALGKTPVADADLCVS